MGGPENFGITFVKSRLQLLGRFDITSSRYFLNSHSKHLCIFNIKKGRPTSQLM